jgi:[protein-PII] uridylyltransferase
MILISSGRINSHKENIEGFLAFLWDIQLKIGHSVRSISDCFKAAKNDVTIATNIMETRTICGEDIVRRKMLKKISSNRIWPFKLWPSNKFFEAKVLEQNKRHAKHGNTEYNLEPNIKEAPGGLRDIQTINWVAKRHFGVDSLEELIGDEFITPEEYLQLKRNEAFLWKVRFALHLIVGRPEERLLFDHQRKIAKMFGYKDGEKRMGVEQFMQHYYQVVLSIRELTDTLFQCFNEKIFPGDNGGKIDILNERFLIKNSYIETTNNHVFARNPSALIEIFCLIAENKKITGIRATTIRQIRQYRKLIDEPFRNSSDNKALFLRLLRSPYNMTTQLQRMTRYGILGRYLPEFGAIIGQTQHDLFHQYPVDAHTLQLIKNMRSFDKPEEAHRFPMTAYVYKNLPKPELAFIAGLYHDIGKGRGGDHSVLGAVDASNFCIRHNISKPESALIAWLVENHLLMSSTSQRSDISDPVVIHKFAKIIGTQIKLDYLLVLTVADIIATNPNLWNNWRASLMRQLYTRTKKALNRGLENPESRKKWVQNTKEEAIRRIIGISRADVEKLWLGLDDDFFLRESANDIVRYTEAILKNNKEDAPVILIKDKGLGTPIATQIFVGTRGFYKVFPIIAATLDKLQLRILDASLHTTLRNTKNKKIKEAAFDIFYVVNNDAEPFGKNLKIVTQIEVALKKAFRDPKQSNFGVNRRVPQNLKQFSTTTKVNISSDINGASTILEVITPDRPGLLLYIGQIFTKFQIQLISAKISTLGERVEDVFHIVDDHYKPLRDPTLCLQLERAICDELDARVMDQIEGAPLEKMSLWN